MTQKLNPSILYWQFTPSIYWRHQLGNITSNLSFGVGTRLSRNLSTQKPVMDALIISSKLNLDQFSIGLFYDVNTSPLAQVSLTSFVIFDDRLGCVNCYDF